jgi:hypothetical protein
MDVSIADNESRNEGRRVHREVMQEPHDAGTVCFGDKTLPTVRREESRFDSYAEQEVRHQAVRRGFHSGVAELTVRD